MLRIKTIYFIVVIGFVAGLVTLSGCLPGPTSPAPTPQKDIVDTAIEAGTFTTLVGALQATGLEEAARGEGPLTVFAPTDEAFAKLPEGALAELDTDELRSILLYHIVSGRVLAEDITCGLSVPTLEGSNVTFSLTDEGVMINDAMIIAADIMASNGVIHVIDSVIFPPGM